MRDANAISALRIRIACAEQILQWSSGEVTEAVTLNYRTLKPEPEGLFSERIFGPEKDWTCACGRYKRAHTPGFVCEKCHVELTTSSVRRERMGHIQLAAPVAHIWFWRSSPSRIGLLLGLSVREVAAVLSFARYLITSINQKEGAMVHAWIEAQQTRGRSSAQIPPREEASSQENSESYEERPTQHELSLAQESLATATPYALLDEDHFRALERICPHVFQTSIGAEGIRQALDALDLDALSEDLRESLQSEQKPDVRKKTIRRLQVVESFQRSEQNPASMILTVLPVLPPDLRPMVPLEGGRFAVAEVNDLYCRVIHRNNRIKQMQLLNAPEIILRNEKRMLQQACDALFDNLHTAHPTTSSRGRAYKSLSDAIRGKKGRFRKNLLGKRVDYSGRSVICAGLDLQLHECGLPKKIGLELFKPFVIRKLVEQNHARSEKQAKYLVEQGDRAPAVVWDLLAECMHHQIVLLNRAPTLHRLSIRAFEAKLIEGNAIRLHPLVCSGFNADFDGDQMAVHLPLSPQAQDEARRLMLATKNMRSPATGEPAVTLSQDMVLGCYYLTQDRPSTRGQGHIFGKASEALLAYDHNCIDLHARISVRMPNVQVYDAPPSPDVKPKTPSGRVETTVGRILLNEALPSELCFRNYPMTKDLLKQLVAESLLLYDEEKTAHLCDALKTLGFHYATRSGISFAMSDIVMPPERDGILADADARVQDVMSQFHTGLITKQERYLQAITIWTEATDEMSKHLQKVLDPYGSIATISGSGATKAKLQQIRQLSGMRGLMASPSGRIIEVPIRTNYKIGLTAVDYFNGAHGARKSLGDRSLNTAVCGYRTIILVEVGQAVTITMHDCGDHIGLLITQQESIGRGLPSMRTRLIGRVLAERIQNEALDVPPGTELTEQYVDRLLFAGVTAVRVRSPLSCQATRGLCALCYGHDLSKMQLVQQRTAVGVIAAQSIGEPGTQLTMRTFHTGGIAGAPGDIMQGMPRVNELFEARVPKGAAMLTKHEGVVTVEDDSSKKEERRIRVTSEELVVDEYPLSDKEVLCIQSGQQVKKDQPLTSSGITARTPGIAAIQGQLLTITGFAREQSTYLIPKGRALLVSTGQHVHAGEPLCAGPIDPHQLLQIAGRDVTQQYLVAELQKVYRTTGAYIHDKHLELIIRQMARRVLILDGGDTPLLPENLLDRFELLRVNALVLAQGGQPATAEPVLLGTLHVGQINESWLAAASFQHTTRVLAKAAVEGRIDRIEGFKEHILVGKRIPIPAEPRGV